MPADHRVEVVPVVLETHPNADTLSVVKIAGFTACVRTADFAGVDRAAYIEPDSLVPVDRPWSAFLAPRAKPIYGDRARITVVKLRGVLSMGLLVAPLAGTSWEIGQDVAAELGVEHYNPPEAGSARGTGGEAEAAPAVLRTLPKYDVDSWRRYGRLFMAGEPVVVTEKIHGASARYVWHEGRLWVGSRAEWKREDAGNVWWRALRGTEGLAAWCEAHPNVIVYGEVYGWVQELRYGAAQGQVWFRAFDLRHGTAWLPHAEARALGAALPWVPVLYEGPYDAVKIEALAEGPSTLYPKHVREGCVVKPLVEREDAHIGRVQLKIVGSGYLEKA